MNSKLTLKLNTKVIEQAKSYASRRNTSLSKLIESYLDMLVDPDKEEEITPLVKSLSGIVNEPEVEYKKHIATKYTKK
jgi:hypothetical protein